MVTVKVTDDQEYVAREMQRYDFTAMPVLDLSLIHISGTGRAKPQPRQWP